MNVLYFFKQNAQFSFYVVFLNGFNKTLTNQQMQQVINFAKYHGAGNDFILINALDTKITLTKKQIEHMCHRRFGIGADGLMILKRKKGYDFEMDFYNSDGNPGSMCGNGGRCIVAFAHDNGLIDEKTTFWAPDGKHSAIFKNYDHISLQMADVKNIEKHELGLFMNTGSPHLVINKTNAQNLDVYQEGKKIRNTEPYKATGVNVNFFVHHKKIPKIYTYERGVENETYACGTGTVATAITYSLTYNTTSPIVLQAKGGLLKVYFKQTQTGLFEDIWLEGPAYKTFDGIININ